MRKGLVGAVALTALLALYVWQIGTRSFALVGTGEPVAVLIGLAVLLVPALAVGLIAREWQLGLTVQRMADDLAGRGELPVDDLPRSPGGRIDREAADSAFVSARTAVEDAPDSWAARYHLAFAYDAARDRRRARAALRDAARLYRAAGRTEG
ncbi:hypothetical protein [Sanguibacter suaedae]|uniref:hypothetical protein n=1 Tax=Sanguibacter suaedae TaxID=2795737 RepID=UPI003557A4B1